MSNFSSGRPAHFPGPIGWRTVYRFGLPGQAYYPHTLGAGTAATRLALDPPWVTALCAGMMRLGAGPLLQRSTARRPVVRLFGTLQRVYSGQNQYALVLEVGGARGIAKLSLTGREESAGTALGAAMMARGLSAGEVGRPGVWLPEQVIEPGSFFDRLAARGLYVTSSG